MNNERFLNKKLEDNLSHIQSDENIFLWIDEFDLTKSLDRINRLKNSHKRFNTLVEDCDIYHECGCCDKAKLYASPYVLVDNVKKYAYPEKFLIGERCGYGDHEFTGWARKLRDEKIPEKIILIINKYFDDNPAQCDEESGFHETYDKFSVSIRKGHYR